MSTREEDWKKSPFYYLNFAFTLAGFDLREYENLDERRSNSLKRFLLVIVNWVLVAFSLWQQPWNRGIMIEALAVTPKILQTLVQINVLWNLNEIKQFTANLCENVEEQTRRRLRFFSLIWITINGATIIGPLALMIEWNKIYSVLGGIIGACLSLTNSIVTSMPLQLFSLFLLHSQQKRQIASLYQEARRGRDDIIFDISQKMKNSSMKFEKLFSSHRFGWLIFNFILTTFSFIITSHTELRGVAMLMFYFQLFTTLPFPFMVWANEQVSQHEVPIVFTYAMGCESGCRDMNPTLFRVLHEALSFKFSVWGLLPINRELIFSFITTVLTFSVLAIQILDGSLVSSQRCAYQDVTNISSPVSHNQSI